MRIDLPCCGFKNCRHCFDGNCTKPSEQGKCEYWYLLYEESEVIRCKNGEWICQADDDIFNCSECDFEIDATGCIDPMEYLKTYNFCPNCGADMRGEKDR